MIRELLVASLSLAACFLAGCMSYGGTRIEVIDGCEYVIDDSDPGYELSTHKADCTNTVHKGAQ